jgi:hypothetical protein
VEALKVELDKLPYDNYEMLDIITEHLKKLVCFFWKVLLAVFCPNFKPREFACAVIVVLSSLCSLRVAANAKQNLMQASNLGVVFGPTLMRSREETMAAIMNLKYQTIVVELMINEYDAVNISKRFIKSKSL